METKTYKRMQVSSLLKELSLYIEKGGGNDKDTLLKSVAFIMEVAESLDRLASLEFFDEVVIHPAQSTK